MSQIKITHELRYNMNGSSWMHCVHAKIVVADHPSELGREAMYEFFADHAVLLEEDWEMSMAALKKPLGLT